MPAPRCLRYLLIAQPYIMVQFVDWPQLGSPLSISSPKTLRAACLLHTKVSACLLHTSLIFVSYDPNTSLNILKIPACTQLRKESAGLVSLGNSESAGSTNKHPIKTATADIMPDFSSKSQSVKVLVGPCPDPRPKTSKKRPVTEGQN